MEKNTDVKTVFSDPPRYVRRLKRYMHHKAVNSIKHELYKQLNATPKHLPAICFTVWISKHSNEIDIHSEHWGAGGANSFQGKSLFVSHLMVLCPKC